MTNREWILGKMQNMSDEELGKILLISRVDKNFSKDWCQKVCTDKNNCYQCRNEWLNQKHKEKIKLSEAKRVILENIEKKYKWIARDKSKHIYVYTEWSQWAQGEKEEGLRAFDHLFKFIKWEDAEPCNIEELLK